MQVLLGAEMTLKSLQVVALETVEPSIQGMMEQYGFQRIYYDPLTREVSPTPVGFPSSNAIFVRDVEAVKERVSTAAKISVLGRLI